MKDDRFYLLHVRDAIGRVSQYTAGGPSAFHHDTKTQDAVIRNLEIIGEAVKRISTAATDRHSDIPWKQIAGMRDVLIHHYFGVNLDTVWQVVETHLPALLSAVEQLLAQISMGQSDS